MSCWKIGKTSEETIIQHESNVTVSEAQLAALTEKIGHYARRSEVMVFGGRVPGTLPVSIYADLIGLAKQAGCRTILDASGKALRHGIQARPYMIKPNRSEMEELLDGQGRQLGSLEDVIEALRSHRWPTSKWLSSRWAIRAAWCEPRASSWRLPHPGRSCQLRRGRRLSGGRHRPGLIPRRNDSPGRGYGSCGGHRHAFTIRFLFLRPGRLSLQHFQGSNPRDPTCSTMTFMPFPRASRPKIT